MAIFDSIVETRGEVAFPKHTGERVYMREIRKAKALPFDLARWQPTVEAMLDGIDTDGPIYLMVDQGIVRAGSSHRRSGIHIDGYWIPNVQAPGGGGHGGHRIGCWENGSGWAYADFKEPEGILLASSVSAAQGFSGTFEGQPGDGGDCTHLDISNTVQVPFLADRTYAGNVTMLHESMPVTVDCLRTVVRLNVPGWSPSRVM